uniref:Uncharacterized protein n=1 Tax=Globisporangium ultimum (strain ATCC 200006 / CBS 805.95 / DAOM BR144) TaxID=431595 RepID=K3X4I8_GLOUD
MHHTNLWIPAYRLQVTWVHFQDNSATGTGTNSTVDVPQVPAKIPRDSPTPPKAGELHPCIPISVEGDATYCVPPNTKATGTLGCSGLAIGESTSPNPGSVRICPRKGEVAIDACHPHLQSFNAATNSCIAPKDSECVVIHTGIWRCTFSFSPSFAWKLTSVEALTRTSETPNMRYQHPSLQVLELRYSVPNSNIAH